MQKQKRIGRLQGPPPEGWTLRPCDAAVVSQIIKANHDRLSIDMVAGDPVEKTFVLEGLTSRLDAFASSFVVGNTGETQQGRFTGILHALFAASRLRNRSDVLGVMRECCEAVCARRPSLAHNLLQCLDSATGIDASSISRVQVLVEAAFCCAMKDVFFEDSQQGGGPIFLWADSSPLHGKDWFLSTMMWVKMDDVLSVGAAIRYLRVSPAIFAAGEQLPMLEAACLREEAGRAISQKVRFHRQMPMALGSGVSSVLHKMKCLMQKLWPEAQSAHLMQSMLRRLAGACVDMGTEMAMPDLSGPELADLFPSWLQGPLFLEDDSGMAAANPLPNAASNTHVLPNCLLVAGTCHIFHNLNSDIDTAMTWFESFVEGFMPLMYLLSRDQLRQRFVATCVRGSAWASCESLLTLRCPTHQTWRWGSLREALQCIMQRRRVLQATWDSNKFLNTKGDGSFGEVGSLDEGDSTLLKLDILSRTIKSKMF